MVQNISLYVSYVPLFLSWHALTGGARWTTNILCCVVSMLNAVFCIVPAGWIPIRNKQYHNFLHNLKQQWCKPPGQLGLLSWIRTKLVLKFELSTFLHPSYGNTCNASWWRMSFHLSSSYRENHVIITIGIHMAPWGIALAVRSPI